MLTSIARDHRADRRVCDNRKIRGKSFLCKAPFKRTEGQSSTGIADVDAAYRLMGVTLFML